MLDLLKRVSRSLYLTIRVLPRDMRRPISAAYLLARAADIIADTRAVHSPGRLEVLRALRNSIEHGTGFGAVEVSMMSAQASIDERDLLGDVAELVNDLRTIPLPDWDLVRDIVIRLTEGMEFDLTRFPLERRGEVDALDTADELDTYTYMVAGCVGEFWTDVTMRHTPPLANWDRDSMVGLGVRFGKALQMTNVLRDVPTDLRIGRCYIPEEWIQDTGLTARDLLDPTNAATARPALVRGLVIALEHFDAAEAYLMAIPGQCARLRLSGRVAAAHRTRDSGRAGAQSQLARPQDALQGVQGVGVQDDRAVAADGQLQHGAEVLDQKSPAQGHVVIGGGGSLIQAALAWRM